MPILSSRGALSIFQGTPIFPSTQPGLWATGKNASGQLGTGDNTDRNVFTLIDDSLTWTQVECGGFYNTTPDSGFTIAKKSDGTLWSTGDNTYGMLGDGSNTARNTFAQIGSSTDWDKFSCGSYGTLAIKTDNTMWGWGFVGACGFGNASANYSSPTQMGSDTDWAEVACAGYFALAIKTDGTLWSAGYNNVGQLGDGTNNNNFTFTQVGSDTDWQNIQVVGTTTSGASYAQKSNGYIYSSGYNADGQLGIGTYIDVNTFTSVSNNQAWQNQWYAGSSYLSTFDANNYNYYSGASRSFDINNPTVALPDTNVLTDIGYGNSYTEIYAGTSADYLLFAKNDNSLWTAGLNFNGMIGLNLPTTAPDYLVRVPRQLTYITNNLVWYGSSKNNRFNFLILS